MINHQESFLRTCSVLHLYKELQYIIKDIFPSDPLISLNNNRNIRINYEICPKLTIKTLERRQ